MSIKISAAVPKQVKLIQSDPTGGTFVVLRPPGMRENLARGELLSKRFNYYDGNGNFVTGIDCNHVDLARNVIWWVYEDTNLVVELDREGKTEIVSFKPREDTNYREFMESLDKLGVPEAVPIFNEWYGLVLDFVPAWRNPF